jgi:hypothetical protein
MKHLYKTLLLAIFTLTIVSACKKDNSNPTNSIVGEWKLVRTKAGIGPPATDWMPTNENTKAIFKSNGTVGGSLFKGYTNYNLTDSISLKVSGSAGEITYIYRVKGDSLNLSNRGCIEGCVSQFVKVK